MFANIVLLAAISQSHSELTLSQAADAVARGENIEAATSRLVRARQPGLWLVHDRAKKEHGEARQHLFEVVGLFATGEAEWALLQELKNGPAEGQLGAIHGLAHCKTTSALLSLLRRAPTLQASLREPLTETLAAIGGVSEQQLRALLEHQSEGAREVAVRYLARAEATPFAREAAAVALRDSSPLVVLQALSLAAHVQDTTQVYSMAEIARTSAEDLAEPAVIAMAQIAGYSTTSELGSIVAFEGTPEKAWRRAAEVLRQSDRAQLVRAMARSSDARRDSVARIAAMNTEAKDLETVIDLLDDPSAGIRDAALSLLTHSGAAGRAAAEARLQSPLLPELETTIKSFLATPPQTSEELSAR